MSTRNNTRTRAAVHAERGAPRRVGSYGRMSQDISGEMLGITRQFDESDALSVRQGWGHIPERLRFDDNDLSAYNGKRRPGFDKLLAAIGRGEIDVLVVWHTDRLYRSMKDLLRIIEVGAPRNLVIKTVTGPELDLSTPTGKAIAQILASIAEMESAHKGERQVLANRQRAIKGEWSTANRAFGYDKAGQPLEPEASAVRQAAVDVLAGKSIQAVAREWNAAGLTGTLGKPWSSQNLRRVLVRPRYAGLKVHQGAVVGPGTWTPLIDPDTHKGLVAYLSDPARVKCTSFERKYIGSGLYRCGICDDGTTLKVAQPGGSRAGGRRYVCRAKAHLVCIGEPLDDYVTGWVVEILSAPKAQLRLANQQIDLGDLAIQRKALTSRKDAVRRAHQQGSLDEAEYFSDLAELTAQIRDIDSQQAEATRTSPAARLVAAGATIWEAWQQMSPTERAQAVDEIATVTVNPVTVMRPGFDENRVAIVPNRGPARTGK